MAYSFVQSSSQYISADSAAVKAEPLTIHVRTKPTTAAESTVRITASVCASGATTNAWLGYSLNAIIHAWQAGNGSNAQSATSASLTANWQSTCKKFSSNASRTAYLNAESGTTNTTSITTSNVDKTLIGAYIASGAISGYANGLLCDVAIWSVALTNDEISSLSKGFKPTRIRPQSLVFYAPLIRNLQDLKAGLALTNNNGATATTHPRVY